MGRLAARERAVCVPAEVPKPHSQGVDVPEEKHIGRAGVGHQAGVPEVVRLRGAPNPAAGLRSEGIP
eukprot:3432253-Heterocapsa_arctica.AAC.1